MHKAPEDAYAGVEAMFNHAYGICHVKQSEATEKGAKCTGGPGVCFAILKRTGFRGPPFRWSTTASGDPYKETEELIAKSLQFLS